VVEDVRLIPAALGYMAGRRHKRRGDLEARARLLAWWRVVEGSAGLLDQPLPSKAGLVAGLFRFTSFALGALALGSAVASTGRWSRPGQRAPDVEPAAAAGGLLFR